jgi:hypothetical protein
VRVSYERRGSSVVVPVRLRGPRGEVAARMLFDTGATLTTLDRPTLARLGIFPSFSDPKVKARTAAGVVEQPITVIEGVAVGGAWVSGGVTVGLCPSCAAGEVKGLLGLNVTRHFKVTLDHAAGQLVLAPRAGVGHLMDIRPFVKMSGAKGSWRGPQLTVTARLENRAPRMIRALKVTATVEGEGQRRQIWTEVERVAARSAVEIELQGLLPITGARFSLEVEEGDW